MFVLTFFFREAALLSISRGQLVGREKRRDLLSHEGKRRDLLSHFFFKNSEKDLIRIFDF